jgi:DNA repair protein RadC
MAVEAAVEIGRATTRFCARTAITSASKANLLSALLIATSQMLQCLSSGTRTNVMVDQILMFRNALLLGARSIIVAHNHPDGSLAPSAQDLVLTKSLIEAGQILNIEVLDHIIVTPRGTCASLKEREPHLFPPSKPAAPVT